MRKLFGDILGRRVVIEKKEKVVVLQKAINSETHEAKFIRMNGYEIANLVHSF